MISGNRAWRAAAEVRKRWLASLFARRTAPREVAPFVARQLLTMPDPLRSGLAAAPGRSLFSEITGQPAASWLEACDTVAAGRVPLLMLGPIVTAFEQAMTEGEKRAELRLIQHSVRRDIGVSAGRKGVGCCGRNVIDGSACTACAGPPPTQQCCI